MVIRHLWLRPETAYSIAIATPVAIRLAVVALETFMSVTGTAPDAQQPTASPSSASLMAIARVRIAANWFNWIAGLSLINSAVIAFGGNFHFVIGLGITAFVDELAKRAGSMGTVLDLIINGFVAGVFFLFGYFGKQAHKWAFLVGMTFYALDGGLALLAGDILSAGFHAYALFMIYRGFAAIGQFPVTATPAAALGSASLGPQ
jgi:hypothetical protein